MDKRCTGFCVIRNDYKCCYDCEKNKKCKNACLQFRNNDGYDNCFLKSIKIPVDKKPISCTGTGGGSGIIFFRGLPKSKTKISKKIKLWINRNISWRFRRYPPDYDY